MEIKYDTPVEVTEKQCEFVRKKYGMQLAWRKDDEGRYWIKLWNMDLKDELENDLSK